MGRANTNVSNTNKFLMITHPKVAKVWREAEKNEFNRNAVVVRVRDGRVRIVYRISNDAPVSRFVSNGAELWHRISSAANFASNKDHGLEVGR